MRDKPFSSQLEAWLKNSQPKTIGSLTKVFAEKSFAIIVLILMFFPALPIPSAAHPLELITMLIGLEMIAGRRTLWLPKFILKRNLGDRTIKKALPFIVRRIKWFERMTRPRFRDVMDHQLFLRVCGLIFFIFALAAALALPFSGLDTLPALGAVIVALSIIFGDAAIFLIGLVVGLGGIALEIALGAAAIQAFRHFF